MTMTMKTRERKRGEALLLLGQRQTRMPQNRSQAQQTQEGPQTRQLRKQSRTQMFQNRARGVFRPPILRARGLEVYLANTILLHYPYLYSILLYLPSRRLRFAKYTPHNFELPRTPSMACQSVKVRRGTASRTDPRRRAYCPTSSGGWGAQPYQIRNLLSFWSWAKSDERLAYTVHEENSPVRRMTAPRLLERWECAVRV